MRARTRRNFALLSSVVALLVCFRFASIPGADEKAEGQATLGEAAGDAAIPASSPVKAAASGGVDPSLAGIAACPHCAGRGVPAAVSLRLPEGFVADLAAAGREMSFALPDGRVARGIIDMRVPGPDGGIDAVSGHLTEPGPGRFSFQREREPGFSWPLSGTVEIFACNTAYRVETRGQGESHLVALPADAVVCRGMAVHDEAGGEDENLPSDHPTSIPIPPYQNGVLPLQSLPGMPAVAYLDFDGEPGPHLHWGDFDASSYNFTNSKIRNIWLRVSEDFAPFNINVTTDLAVYLAAPPNSRQRCIITPTKDAAPTAGGVANIGSFNNSSEIVCWAYNSSTDKICADTISHELGHTLVLRHDGRTAPLEEYYDGHGTGTISWGPLMGSPFDVNITQWSKGEYTAASRTEDDLAIIAGSNNSVDYRADDSGNTISTARYLEIQSSGTVSGQGMIEKNTDADAFRFRTTATGSSSLTVKPVAAGPNLDVLAEIIDGAGNVVASANPVSDVEATVTASLPAGEYALRISGTGAKNPLTDGYSSYGSLGAYSISGTVANAVKPDRFTLAETALTGALAGTVTPRLSHGANPLQYSLLSGNTNGAFTLDTSTGQLRVASSSAIDFEALSVTWETPAVFELFVTLTDMANPVLNEVLRVVVTVTDVNESPVFSGGSTVIPERLSVGSTVFVVAASDPDRFDRIATYQIIGGNSAGFFSISSTGVITTVAPPSLAAGGSFDLSIRVGDGGSPSKTATATVSIQLVDIPEGMEPGGTYRTIYDGISGTTVASLTGDVRFPTDPDREIFLTSLEDSGRGTWLGSATRGHLIAPYKGTYTFWIAGDDACQLLLSTDDDPSHATARASLASSVAPRNWDVTPGQKSAGIQLTAGQVCYLEVRQKQSTSDEHFSVAWSVTRSGETLLPRQVISGNYLAPHFMNYRPRVEPALFSLYENTAPGNAIGGIVATDFNDGQSQAYAITGGSGAGVFGIRASDGMIIVPDPSLLSPSASYTLNVTATDNGSPPLSGNGTVMIDLRPAGRLLAGLQVLSSPVESGATTGSGVFRRGQTVPISVTPAAGQVFQQWTGGGVAAPSALSTSVVVDAFSGGVAGANFSRMSLTNQTAPLPASAAVSDLTWSLLGTGQDMDVVDDSVLGGIGGDEALRIDGVSGNNRGLLGTWPSPVSLEIGDTVSVAVDVRYHEAPASNSAGLMLGLTSSASKDHTFSVRIGTGTSSGFSLTADANNDASPGTGSFATVPSTVSGTVLEPINTFPVTIVFSIHRTTATQYTIGAAVGGAMLTGSHSLGWPAYDSFYIRNGAINADFTIDNVLVSRSSAKRVTAVFTDPDPYAAWVAGYPLSGPAAGKDADPDGDGVPNFAEMHLGFSPVDAASRLTLSIIGVQNGSARLVANRLVTAGTFRLDWSDSLAGTWEGSQAVPVAADGWNVEMPVATDVPRRFYRLTYLPPTP